MARLAWRKKGASWKDWLWMGVGVVLLARTGENIARILKNQQVLAQAEARLENLKEEGRRLRGQLEWVKSDEFVEREAREKLGWGREGEAIVIIPKEKEPERVRSNLAESGEAAKPNWRRWWELYGWR